MNDISCETVRDMLPTFAHSGRNPIAPDPVSRHLAVCATCAAEAEVVRLIHGAREPVPAGLEQRVLSAVQSPVSVGMSFRTPVRMAAAAAVAAAVIGGSLVFRSISDTPGDASDATGVVAAGNVVETGSWAVDQDPLLHGGSSIQSMSVEELEFVLQELDR